MYIYIYIWLVVWNIFIFPYTGDNSPNWRTPSFFRGVGQPPTRSTNKAVAFCVVAELQHPEMNYGPGVSGELRVTHDSATWPFMVPEFS